MAFDVSVMTGFARQSEMDSLQGMVDSGTLRYVIRCGPYPLAWCDVDDQWIVSDARYGAKSVKAAAVLLRLLP